MAKVQFLQREKTGLLIVDVQEKLFERVERSAEVLEVILQVIKGFKTLHLPIVVTEQYPQGLGSTVPLIKSYLDKGQKFWSKTTFSCVSDKSVKEYISSLPVQQWVVVGIEAHVCVLQTVKELLLIGKDPVVLNDAITSRSIYDFSTAIAEMRDLGVRVTSAETILFELVRDSKAPEFKAISQIVKEGIPVSGCCRPSCCQSE